MAGFNPAKVVSDKLHEVRKVPTRTWISIFKATLAYMALVVMVMSDKVRSAFSFPITLSGAVVVVVAAMPGANTGQCMFGVILGMLGVGLGGGAFAILALLSSSPVAQGFVLAIIIYFFALFKAKSIIFFGFALLGTLVAFAGVYTSLAAPPYGFNPRYLEDYLKSYALGGAIVIVVNLAILPISSEKELRRTLVTSLDHIKTFAHLIIKSYTLEITEEEKAVRDGLAQSIRADYGVLQQKLGTSMLEVNRSRFSMDDYRKLIGLTHKMQQDLIGMYSTIKLRDLASAEINAQNTATFKQNFSAQLDETMPEVRKQVADVIRSVCAVLGDKIAVAELQDYEAFRSNSDDDLSESDQRTLVDTNKEKKLAPIAGRGRSATFMSTGNRLPITPGGHCDTVDNPLEAGLGQRLDAESNVTKAGITKGNLAKSAEGEYVSDGASPNVNEVDPLAVTDEERNHPLLAAHFRLRQSQQAVVAKLLLAQANEGDDLVRVDNAGRPLAEVWSAASERTKRAEAELSNRKRGRLPKDLENDEIKSRLEIASDLTRTKDGPSGQERLLLGVVSFSFLGGQFARDLVHMHEHVKEIAARPSKRWHIHIFEKEKRGAPISAIPETELLARLEGRTPVVPPKVTLGLRLAALEGLVRSDISISAMKTTAAAITFAAILLAPSSRPFFVQYTLTGGVLSVIVAMSPSIDESYLIALPFQGLPVHLSARQTLFTFRYVIGTVTGSIYGMILLYIFKDVGGYHWNPYGLTCMLLPLAVIMCYLVYTSMPLLPLALLALNGASLVIFTEVVYANVPTYTVSPALRAGQNLVSMCCGLAIAFAFQYLIDRSPARKLLRQATADLMSSVLAYQTLLAGFTSALSDESETLDGKPLSRELIDRTSLALAKQEAQIQGQIIAMYPLMAFAKLEPEIATVFRGDLYRKIAVNVQLFLDRMRESRVMIADATHDGDAFSALAVPVLQRLSPYRRFHNRLTRHRIFMLATALHSKTPLLQDSLSSRLIPAGQIHHDALVLTARIAQQDNGAEVLHSLAFLRAWSYLLSVASFRVHLQTIEDAVGELLGVYEDDQLFKV